MNERHEGKHLRRQEAKKRWKTILAVFLSVVLVMQSSNIQAFADVLASGGSEGRDEVVMDPAAEDTGTQGEVTTPEETDTADEQASSQDDAEQTVAETEENPVETTAQDTEATTPDGQSDQAQSEQAPAEETDTTVTLNVEVSAATLKYSAQDGTEKSVTSETDPKSVDVSNTLDFTFTVAPDDGQRVSSVAYAGAELTANDSGEYTIAAADLTDGEKIVVTTEAAPTEEPAEDTTPVEPEDAAESTEDEATTTEDASESETPAANNGISTMAARAVDFTVEVGGTISINGSTDGWIPQHKWSVDSGDGQVRLANIDGQTVRVTGVSEGTVTLKHEYKATVAWNWEEEYFTVQVTPAPTVDITEESLQITLGDEGQLTATATPAGSSVTWSSSDERVATVDQNGLVTTHQTGVATITARNGSASDTATIYVVSPATYRLVYNSNYPDDAKKIVYENGDAGNITLEDAVETNAVYAYEPGSTATVAGDMTLANYEFLGWSTDPNATEPDSTYNPGANVTMDSNLTLYAVWGNKIEIGNQTTVTVRYYKNQSGNSCVDKQTTAFRSWRNGQATYTFVLGNNQDTIKSDSPNLRGWQHDGEYYAFNETITTSEYRAGHNQIIIEVRPWFDNNATYAQFFVLKADDAAYGDEGNYYSVGTGSIDAEIFKSGSANVGDTPTYPNGIENKSNNISELIISAPSPTQIASALNVSLDEAQTVRWYVAKSQSDGYHVDGVIYRAGVYHNVRFVDTATGEVMASYVVEDMGTVLESQIPDTSSLEDFECWVDESGKVLTSGNINLIGDDLTFYTKYKDKYNVTASIVDDEGNPVEGATATPSAQSVTEGQQSSEISFDIPDGYEIEKITVNGQDQTGENAGKTEYTYPAQTVNGDITIIVKVTTVDYTATYQFTSDTASEPVLPADMPALPEADTAKYGQTVTIDPADYEDVTDGRGTWEFLGWTVAGGEEYVTEFAMPVDGTTVTGHWQLVPGSIKSYSVAYTWVGDVPSGIDAAPSASTVKYGTTQLVETRPYAAGAIFTDESGIWTFNGWATDDVTVSNGQFRMPANDVLFTGSWTLTTVDISGQQVTVDYPDNVPYDGTEHTWVPTVTDADGNVLIANRDYTVRYSTSDHTNDENPLASGDEEGIEDNGNPLASGRGDEDCWVHWLILVGMILTAVYFVGVAVRRRKFTADLLDYEDKVLGNNRNDA